MLSGRPKTANVARQSNKFSKPLIPNSQAYLNGVQDYNQSPEVNIRANQFINEPSESNLGQVNVYGVVK